MTKQLLDLLEVQPNFPTEDLTEINELYLSLALRNWKLFKKGHDVAQVEYPIFWGTHDPLRIAAGNLFDDKRVFGAIDFGIAALETMTLFVKADNPTPALEVLETNISGIVSPKNTNGVADYFKQAHAEFLDASPRTAHVISESAERFHPGLAYAAVYGGAIARRFELDNIED